MKPIFLFERTFLLMIVVANGISSIAQTSFASFGYTSANGSSTRQQLVPTTFNDSKVQIIIRADELSSIGLSNGGIISGISYYIKTDNTPADITADCYADLTSNSEFSSTTFFSQPTFRGNITDPGTINEAWRVIDFGSNFITWDGVSNLLIQVCRTSGSQGVSDVNRYKLTSFNSILTGYFNSCSSATGVYHDRRERPEIGISSPNTTLPVTWLNFTGKKLAQGVELNWSTSTEQNTKDFQVQHSINAQQWTGVGTLPAAGTSGSVRNYYFLHKGPFKNSMQHYYRILQRDLDERFSYSKVIRIEYPETKTDVVLYPNPAYKVLHINLAEYQELRLVNMQGVVVWKGVLPAGIHQIPVSNFASGAYLLQTEKGAYKVFKQ